MNAETEKEINTQNIRSRIEQTIHRLYDNSPFIHLCGIELVDIKCGEITMQMKIAENIHVNTHGVVHAGACFRCSVHNKRQTIRDNGIEF